MAGSASNGGQMDFAVGGVPVKFPCKPYPTQMAMMAKIIQALSKGENALLESPTGSGKSLALLCSTLAWQRQELQKQAAAKAQSSAGAPGCNCACHVKQEVSPPSAPDAATASSSEPKLSEVSHAPDLSVVPQTDTALPKPKFCMQASSHGCMSMEADCSKGACVSEVQPMSVGSSDQVEGVLKQSKLAPALQVGNVEGQFTCGREEGGVGKGDNAINVQQRKGFERDKEGGGELDESFEADFKQPKKRFRTPGASEPISKKKKHKGVMYEDASDGGSEGEGHNHPPTWKMELKGGPAMASGLGLPQNQIMDTDAPKVEPNTGEGVGAPCVPTVPCPKCSCGAKQEGATRQKSRAKIFFGTRTHKQITQIVHEMRKTEYSSTPMCILASRQHTCVHPEVSKAKNKNDECKKLLDGLDLEREGCSYYYRVQQKLGSQAQLRQYGYTSAWDIEDLVHLGKRVHACPYFATRNLNDEADIVFCPYNYLIDPMIREQMLLSIEGQVIIFDEAHNMEDSSREAASLSFASLQLLEIVEEIENIMPQVSDKLKLSYQYLLTIVEAIAGWMESVAKTLPKRGYEQACGIWNGHDYIPILRQMGITVMTFEIILSHIAHISEPPDPKEKENSPSISVGSLKMIKNIAIVLGFLFQHPPDYRISLMKSSTMKASDYTLPGGWKRRRSSRYAEFEKVWIYTLNFWCLNPAVAFSQLTCARTIVLTSGTLSPMGSFSSELGVAFPIQLEANHVIPEAQTWVRSISTGPSGRSLLANYQQSETYEFQDEIGELVLRVCKTIPYGVLCFLPSYKMLEKLSNRWQETGLWYKLVKEKIVVSEPRSGEKRDFEDAISQFYAVINEISPDQLRKTEKDEDGEGTLTGALFLAVCRGKVSEGLDFANNNARAVITIGIPFPYIKDKQVELKQEYNNEHSHRRGVLNGREWYQIQAYRALNQALGRCIRHKKDWGALILVDERFAKGPHYTRGLSKWVRNRIQHEPGFGQAMSSLKAFAVARMKADGESSDVSSISLLEKSPKSSLGTSMMSPRVADHSILTGSYAEGHPVLSSPPATFNTCANPITSTPVAPQKRRNLSATVLSTTVQYPSTNGLPNNPIVITSMNHNQSARNQITLQNLPVSHPSSSIPLLPSSSIQQVPSLHPSDSTGNTQVKSNSALNQHKVLPSGSIASPHPHPAFQYPGGIHISTEKAISLADITSLAKEMPLGKTDGTSQPELEVQPLENIDSENKVEKRKTHSLDANVECMDCQTNVPSGEYCGAQKKVDSDAAKPPLVPHTPSLSPASHCQSPLLFDSCESSNETPSTFHYSLAAKLAKKMSKPQLVPRESRAANAEGKAVTAEDEKTKVVNSAACEVIVIDDDVTPPISPVKLPSPRPLETSENRETCNKSLHFANPNREQQCEKCSPTKTSNSVLRPIEMTPLNRPKRRANTRLAARKSETMKQQFCTSRKAIARVKSASEDSDDVDFKPEKPKTPTKPPTATAQTDVEMITCTCGINLSKNLVTIEKTDLKEAFSKRYASYKVHTIQTSRLCTHMKGKSKKRNPQIYIVPASEISCYVKDGSGDYNAVWDEKLGLCYALVQCKCGIVVGVKVHTVQGTERLETLVGKVILSAERIKASLNS